MNINIRSISDADHRLVKVAAAVTGVTIERFAADAVTARAQATVATFNAQQPAKPAKKG